MFSFGRSDPPKACGRAKPCCAAALPL